MVQEIGYHSAFLRLNPTSPKQESVAHPFPMYHAFA